MKVAPPAGWIYHSRLALRVCSRAVDPVLCMLTDVSVSPAESGRKTTSSPQASHWWPESAPLSHLMLYLTSRLPPRSWGGSHIIISTESLRWLAVRFTGAEGGSVEDKTGKQNMLRLQNLQSIRHYSRWMYTVTVECRQQVALISL